MISISEICESLITFQSSAFNKQRQFEELLSSNKEKDTFEALRKFRKREWLEDFFEEYKQRIGGKKFRVWDELGRRIWF